MPHAPHLFQEVVLVIMGPRLPFNSYEKYVIPREDYERENFHPLLKQFIADAFIQPKDLPLFTLGMAPYFRSLKSLLKPNESVCEVIHVGEIRPVPEIDSFLNWLQMFN